MQPDKPQIDKRFIYISKETIEDALLWADTHPTGLSKFPIVYDRLTKKYISVEEYVAILANCTADQAIHPNQYPAIIDKPGDYRTRNGKRVTIHEIATKKSGDDCMEFCAKGSFWKTNVKMGTNPEYGIWHVSGLSKGIGIHQNDIVGKW